MPQASQPEFGKIKREYREKFSKKWTKRDKKIKNMGFLEKIREF